MLRNFVAIHRTLQKLSRTRFLSTSSSLKKSLRFKSGQRRRSTAVLLGAVGASIGIGCTLTWFYTRHHRTDVYHSSLRCASTALCTNIGEEGESGLSVAAAGQVRKDLPEFTLEDVAAHRSVEAGIWVTYGDGVYDITDFVDAHPGGKEKLMMAAGKSLEPFWNMYPVHDNEFVHSIIEEELRIGNIAPQDRGKCNPVTSQDYFAYEPERSSDLLTFVKKPYSGETPMNLLAKSFLTPNELFHVRNHFAVPKIDTRDFVLEVSGEGIETVKLSLDDLKSKFTEYTVNATLQCAGNRRNELTKVRGCGTNAYGGHISNAEWTGVRLRDVLAYAGVAEVEEYTLLQHVHLEGIDCDPLTGERYGVSIPIHKAMSRRGDCILAYCMNGEELPRDHGYPLRAVVPGTAGARSVKWLTRIVASEEEHTSDWQQIYYKGFSPSASWNEVDFSSAPAIQEMPVQSLICSPEDGSSLNCGSCTNPSTLTVSGVAWSGGGRGIVRVDVSCDGGKTWQTANLLEGSDQPYGRAWAWTIWSADLQVPSDRRECIELCCKAVDSSYNVQPDTSAPIWNAGGYLSNAWHRVFVNITL